VGMIQVFLPSSELVEPEQGKTVLPQGAERRRHTRHRFSQNLEIIRGDDEYEAMTFEISEGGLSAATANILKIGELVELNLVLGERLRAIVRRKHGAMYGFEFLGLTEEQREKIKAKCKVLPPFRSLIDI
jgi:hypothetical protein